MREQCIEHMKILDKVKKLFLIPNVEVMTIEQIAEYYETDSDAIKKCYQRNQVETDDDGTSVKTHKDLLMGHNVPLESAKGKTIIHFDKNLTLAVPNRGIRCFSRRAILRIAMLLCDSEIAKEVPYTIVKHF